MIDNHEKDNQSDSEATRRGETDEASPGGKTRHREIHIFVDGEPVTTTNHEMTPNQIIGEFGGLDPTTHYLVQIKGSHKVSYEGKGGEPIKLHDGERFQIISTGPTPVSEAPIHTGVGVFIDGLRDLGFNPISLAGHPDHVVIDYTVETGRFAGRQVRLGFIVPSDFPVTPPSGPQVSPFIHPLNGNGEHPSGRVHAAPQEFADTLKGDWQYWSRPFVEWARTKKTVATYMSHIWRLWDSQ